MYSQLLISTKLKIFSIILSILFIISIAFVMFLNYQRASIAVSVNVAGLNRMRTQRIAYLFERFQNGELEVRPELAELIDLHEKTLETLRYGGEAVGSEQLPSITLPPDSVLQSVIKTEHAWKEFKHVMLTHLATTGDQKDLRDFHNLADQVLTSNNSVVDQYVEYDQRLANRFNYFIIFVFLTWPPLILAFIFELAKIMKNLAILTASAKKLSNEQYDFKININGSDEFFLLSSAFNDMSEKINLSFRQLNKTVSEKSDSLQLTLKQIEKQNQTLQDSKSAILNVLEDLETEKKRDEALLASIGEGMAATDASGKVIFVNQAFTNILGWTNKEVSGRLIFDVLKLLDKNKKIIPIQERPLTLTIKTGKGVKVDNVYYVRKDKQAVPVDITITPIVIDTKIEGVIQVFRDVTKERSIDKAKTEFVSLASHQLRTPLTAINWYTELLTENNDKELSEDQQGLVSEISKSSKRMVELVNALLNVSRIELGTFAVSPKITDIVSIADVTLHELEQFIEKKKLKIIRKSSKNLPKVKVDPDLMSIVYQNLLTNAVKYTPDKGTVTITHSLDTQDAIEYIHIAVSDTGYGIPENQANKVFSKLFRASNVKEKDTEGTGLGLYIVKSIIDQSNGKIWFESKENEGTTFHILLPKSGMVKKEGSKPLEKNTH